MGLLFLLLPHKWQIMERRNPQKYAYHQKLCPRLRRLFLKKICNMLFSWSVFLILFTLSRFAEETANVELFMSKKWLIKCSIGNSRSKRINFPKWITVICCFDNFFISLIYSSLIFVWFVCFLSFSQLKKSKKMVNYESSIPRFEKFWTQFEQVWVLWLFLL